MYQLTASWQPTTIVILLRPKCKSCVIPLICLKSLLQNLIGPILFTRTFFSIDYKPGFKRSPVFNINNDTDDLFTGRTKAAFSAIGIV